MFQNTLRVQHIRYIPDSKFQPFPFKLCLSFSTVQSQTKLGFYSEKKTDLDDIIVAVFSVDGLHCTDVQATKHLSAGVHPQPISGTQ